MSSTHDLQARAAAVRARFPDDGYTAYHSPRYAYVLAVACERAGSIIDARVLDVGPSVLTTLLSETLGRPVDTLGWQDRGVNATGGCHHEFDLNRLPADGGSAGAGLPDLGQYDVVVFSEVLEHLYVAPVHVLRFLHAHLTGGGTLVLQTPNAAALDRRLKLLLGRHPYDPLDPDNSGERHVRESTIAEVRGYVESAGFEIVSATCHAYFDHRWAAGEDGAQPRAKRRVQNAIDRVAPAGLRPGITIVATASATG